VTLQTKFFRLNLKISQATKPTAKTILIERLKIDNHIILEIWWVVFQMYSKLKLMILNKFKIWIFEIEKSILPINYYNKKEHFLRRKKLDKICRPILKKGEFHFFFGTVMKIYTNIKLKKMMKRKNRIIFPKKRKVPKKGNCKILLIIQIL